MMIFRRILPTTAVCVAALTACQLFAQSKMDTDTATPPQASANEVILAVTVRDKHSDLVPNLSKSDFTLTNDGRPQVITKFTSATSLPLTLGVLVETSASLRGSLENERSAGGKFLDQMMTTPRVKAFLIQFGGEVDLLADVSPEKKKLDTAVGQIGTPQFHNTGDAQASVKAAGSTLYDAIYLASTELMKKQPERKVLIVLSDGIDRGSKTSLFSAIEAAQRANTAVYAMYFKGEEEGKNNSRSPGQQRRGRTGGGGPGGGYPSGYPGGGGGWPGGGGNRPSRPTEGSRMNGERILEQICNETGGHMFEVNRKHPVEQAIATISSELRAQYIVGFTPDKQTGGYSRITLKANNKDLYVQTRQGYYAAE
ncbi:MAG: VWA domain-containing protein [Acidobacteriaceae bacterium]